VAIFWEMIAGMIYSFKASSLKLFKSPLITVENYAVHRDDFIPAST